MPRSAACLSFVALTIGALPGSLSGQAVVPDADPTVAFVHTATPGNTAANYTLIDHPLLDDEPNAVVIATQSYNPGGSSAGVYNDHPIGVFYGNVSNSWGIFNQDLAPMPSGASFNVEVVTTDPDAFVHTSTAASTGGAITLLDHPLLDLRPGAMVLVTPN